MLVKKKSLLIGETLNLLTDADSSTNTKSLIFNLFIIIKKNLRSIIFLEEVQKKFVGESTFFVGKGTIFA